MQNESIFKLFLKNKPLFWGVIGGVAALLVAVILILALGGKKEPAVSQQPTTTAPTTQTKPGAEGEEKPPIEGCTITLKTEGGKALADVGIAVYTSPEKTDMVAFSKTDKDGKVVLADKIPAGSVVVLDGAPAGYGVEESYPITAQTLDIVLKAVLLTEQRPVKLGDVMFDFTVTDTDGTTYKLSEMLKEKQAVVLNLWYIGCEPCKNEFPYLQQAYELYGDKVAVLALNPVAGETEEEIIAFKDSFDKAVLTFPMAKVDPAWAKADENGSLLPTPTTIIIDRFGTVGAFHIGALDDAGYFAGAFEYFTADDYVQSAVQDITTLYKEVEVEQAPAGSEENPLEFSSVTEFELTIKPGEKVYCNVFRVSGMLMTIQDPSVTVLNNGKELKAENGVLSAVVSIEEGESPVHHPVQLVFSTDAAEEKTVKVVFSFLPGTLDNPHPIADGEVKVKVEAGNEQGVYHLYKATKDGVLTVECLEATEDVSVGFSLYNLTTYKMVSFAEDGTVSEGGNPTLSIEVKAGEEVQLIVSTLPNDKNEYVAAELTMKISSGVQEPEEEDPDDNPNEGEGTGGNQGGSTGGNQGGSTGGNQGGSTGGNQGGSTGGNQGGSTGGNQGGSTGGNQGGSTGGNEGGSTGGNQGGTTTPPTPPTPSVGTESGEYEELYVGNAYFVEGGDTTIYLADDVVNYFLYTPSQSGQYKVSIGSGTITYWGGNTVGYIADQSHTESVISKTSTSFTLNFMEGQVGSVVLIGVEGSGSTTLTITRVGASIEEKPWTVYNGLYKPTAAFTYTGGTLSVVDITGPTTKIYVDSNGIYHWGSPNGPVIYVKLNDKTDTSGYLSFTEWLNSERPVIKAAYGSGSSEQKWDFTACMTAYDKYKDKDTGYYPLNEDLKFMLEKLYIGQQWKDNIFANVTNLNEEMAWMFCCYYEKQ